jgi:hypothetical protein
VACPFNIKKKTPHGSQGEQQRAMEAKKGGMAQPCYQAEQAAPLDSLSNPARADITELRNNVLKYADPVRIQKRKDAWNW